MKRKVVWAGDAVIESGFSKCTHNILKHALEDWDVYVLGLNYVGDPHDLPYPVYPCIVPKYIGDLFGLQRVPDLINKIRPDVLFVQNDPWNIPAYMKKAGNAPVVAMMAVDGKNCCGRSLNGLAMAIFWTEFGLFEARAGGYTGPAKVIPLGVDLDIYKSMDKMLARKYMGLEAVKDAFIIGNVNRNQPRKRLDLSVMYFAEWIKEYDIRNAYLFLHVAPTGETGFDVSQLMEYYGLSNRLILVEPEVGYGVKESALNLTYNCFDAQVNTAQGEGWGLTTMEGMACGIPQIVPDWSALGEWARDGAYLVKCTTQSVTPNKINVIGGIPDKEEVILAFQDVYSKPETREVFKQRGFAVVQKSIYRWENISIRVQEAVESALYPRIIREEKDARSYKN